MHGVIRSGGGELLRHTTADVMLEYCTLEGSSAQPRRPPSCHRSVR
eukprot:CAMPEP_0180486768 /NCGR_PEP_ID=MMETSP1036_2-20121128/37168_1 /TAXON_ID=632150 /ORGANISM="Azadinium spinosum, Strain 3D9" /LENGTH=45 /DNA_ID= /DNA_START= /DNA_END= /DNA_ORIENTATION=